MRAYDAHDDDPLQVHMLTRFVYSWMGLVTVVMAVHVIRLARVQSLLGSQRIMLQLLITHAYEIELHGNMI